MYTTPIISYIGNHKVVLMVHSYLFSILLIHKYRDVFMTHIYLSFTSEMSLYGIFLKQTKIPTWSQTTGN